MCPEIKFQFTKERSKNALFSSTINYSLSSAIGLHTNTPFHVEKPFKEAHGNFTVLNDGDCRQSISTSKMKKHERIQHEIYDTCRRIQWRKNASKTSKFFVTGNLCCNGSTMNGLGRPRTASSVVNHSIKGCTIQATWPGEQTALVGQANKPKDRYRRAFMNSRGGRRKTSSEEAKLNLYRRTSRKARRTGYKDVARKMTDNWTDARPDPVHPNIRLLACLDNTELANQIPSQRVPKNEQNS